MPCEQHNHQPWPRIGGQQLWIESCETTCGWCRYSTKSANNLRVHAHRHLKNPNEKLNVFIVKGRAGRGRVGMPRARRTLSIQPNQRPSDLCSPLSKIRSTLSSPKIQELSETEPYISTTEAENELKTLRDQVHSLEETVRSKDAELGMLLLSTTRPREFETSIGSQLVEFDRTGDNHRDPFVAWFLSTTQDSEDRPQTTLDHDHTSEPKDNAISLISSRSHGYILEKILKPLFIKPSLKEFYPIVKDCRNKVGNTMICLRDLEKYLISTAPERAKTAAQYTDFCLTCVQCIRAAVQNLGEHELIRPHNRPYSTEYFISLLEQIKRRAKQIQASKDSEATLKASEEINSAKEAASNQKNISGASPHPDQLPRPVTWDDWSDLMNSTVTGENFTRTVAKIACESCDRLFVDQTHLMTHLESIHPNGLNCPKFDCLMRPTEDELDQHMEDCHPLPASHPRRALRCKSGNCGSSDRIWPRMDSYRNHLKHVHSLNENNGIEDLVIAAELLERAERALNYNLSVLYQENADSDEVEKAVASLRYWSSGEATKELGNFNRAPNTT